MCTRYIFPEAAAVERARPIGGGQPWRGAAHEVFPGYDAPFIRADRESAKPQREMVVGQWNLIPWFAKERKLKFPTSNARSEELAAKASYKHPWGRGQRCIIPATSFYEPNWESGKHVAWNFKRADGEPWGLAGLWNTWKDKGSGEIVESFTMLTLNADAHPLMNRMDRPRPEAATALAGQSQRRARRVRGCRPLALRHAGRGPASRQVASHGSFRRQTLTARSNDQPRPEIIHVRGGRAKQLFRARRAATSIGWTHTGQTNDFGQEDERPHLAAFPFDASICFRSICLLADRAHIPSIERR